MMHEIATVIVNIGLRYCLQRVTVAVFDIYDFLTD